MIDEIEKLRQDYEFCKNSRERVDTIRYNQNKLLEHLLGKDYNLISEMNKAGIEWKGKTGVR